MTRTLWKSCYAVGALVFVPDAQLLPRMKAMDIDKQHIAETPQRVTGAPSFPQVSNVRKMPIFREITNTTVFARIKLTSYYYHYFIFTLKG